MNDLIRPALYSAWQEVTPVTLKDDVAGLERNWDIVGPVCETGDFLAKDRAFRWKKVTYWLYCQPAPMGLS